ncbi:hypothetical protein ABK040_007875 [Willaertia magna]
MKVVALVSGGKDSCYNMLKCVEHGHEIVCIANLRPPNVEVQELDSWMFQTVGHNVISAIAECMEVPLFVGELSGTATQTNLEYDDTSQTSNSEIDEVENLFQLLLRVKTQIPEVKAVSCGAILSDYQRYRVENVCSRLGLVSLSYLWRRDQTELLQEMIDKGMNAILVKTASLGLNPRRMLGKSIGELFDSFMKLKDTCGLNVCGEGGEYETITLDCPLFKKRIVIDKSEIVMVVDDNFAPVGHLKILECHLEKKDKSLVLNNKNINDINVFIPDNEIIKTINEIGDSYINQVDYKLITNDKSSLFYIIANCKGIDNPMIEMFTLFNIIKLKFPDMAKEMIHCVLQLKDMKHFSIVNQVYCHFFLDNINRPSRVCIASNLPENQNIYVECLFDSKKLLPRNLNQTLFVQSVSEWAPACIGPYAQGISHDKIIRLAGQIGLIPETMNLIKSEVENDWKDQLELEFKQSILNVRAVLEGMKSTQLSDCFRCLIYFDSKLSISEDYVNSLVSKYSPTLLNSCLLDYVFVPSLPRGALVEIHVFAIMKRMMEYEELEHQMKKEKKELSFGEGMNSIVESIKLFNGSTFYKVKINLEQERDLQSIYLDAILDNINTCNGIVRAFTSNSKDLDTLASFFSKCNNCGLSSYFTKGAASSPTRTILMEIETLLTNK